MEFVKLYACRHRLILQNNNLSAQVYFVLGLSSSPFSVLWGCDWDIRFLLVKILSYLDEFDWLHDLSETVFSHK